VVKTVEIVGFSRIPRNFLVRQKSGSLINTYFDELFTPGRPVAFEAVRT
jgi:hypothetical protein